MTIYLAMAVAYDVTLATVFLHAFLRGGRPERIGAVVNLAASLLSSVVRISGATSWAPAALIILIIDAVVAFCFYRLATSTTRFWPIWAFGFAMADILVSVAGALLPSTPWLAYETGLGIYAYLALFALAIGSLCLSPHADRGQRAGVRPSCRSLVTKEKGSISESDSPEP
jgi:hypothetical protein